MVTIDSTGVTVYPKPKGSLISRIWSQLRRRPMPAPHLMPWDDISKVVAFRVDLWTTDSVSLELIDKDGGVLRMNEEMSCWKELIVELPEQLPGCLTWDEWFTDVISGPCGGAGTSVFDRDSINGSEHGVPLRTDG